jgi:organic radical activating enzyme
MDKYRNIIAKLNRSRCEVDITLKCSLKCKYCTRCLDIKQYEDESDITEEQCKSFINDVKINKLSFDPFTLLGGEPTLHNNIKKIVEIFVDSNIYKKEVCLVSNFYRSDSRKILDDLHDTFKDKLHIQEYGKKLGGEPKKFYNWRIAPIDYFSLEHLYNCNNRCSIPKRCGLYWSHTSGYTCCAQMASMKRLLGFDCVTQTCKDFTDEKYEEFCNNFCKYCTLSYFDTDCTANDKKSHEINSDYNIKKEMKESKIWKTQKTMLQYLYPSSLTKMLSTYLPGINPLSKRTKEIKM